MGMIWEGLLALACALGLALTGWWLMGLLVRPLPGHEARVLLPVRGEGERLEQQLRGFLWLRGMGLLRCPVMIIDVGLTPRGRELALRLAGRWPEVVLWPAEDLPDYLARMAGR